MAIVPVMSENRPAAGATTMIAVDLDRTLIYSRRWFSGTDLATARCVELRDGHEISFMTTAAMASLEQLASQHIVVPATTRAVAQYQRIALPGGPYRFAVTSNGGTILDNGQPDLQWATAVAAMLRDEGIGLEAVMAALYGRISEAWVKRVAIADGLFCRLVVDESAVPADFVAMWQNWCELRGWKVVRQDRNIYTLPRSLCKSRGVEEVRRRLAAGGDIAADARVLAAGDSALDAGLLAAADAAICPSHSELHSAGTPTWKVAVTTAPGAGAAEEILHWCAEAAAPRSICARFVSSGKV